MPTLKEKLIYLDRHAKAAPPLHLHKSHEQLVKEVAILEQRIAVLMKVVGTLCEHIDNQRGIQAD